MLLGQRKKFDIYIYNKKNYKFRQTAALIGDNIIKLDGGQLPVQSHGDDDEDRGAGHRVY